MNNLEFFHSDSIYSYLSPNIFLLFILNKDMVNDFKKLNFSDKDVISFGENVYKVSTIYKFFDEVLNDSCLPDSVGSIFNQIGISIEEGTEDNNYESILTQGSRCEVLNVGANRWRKGRIRVKLELEFCWDEVEIDEDEIDSEYESPLDDLRRSISKDD